MTSVGAFTCDDVDVAERVPTVIGAGQRHGPLGARAPAPNIGKQELTMTKIALLFRISQIGVTISAIGMTIDLALSMGYLAAAMATFV